MSLESLYQQIILDHYRNPRNFKDLQNVPGTERENPTCGDILKVVVTVKSGKLASVKFHGHGCALSISSASIMTEEVREKPLSEVYEIIDSIIAVFSGNRNENVLDEHGEMKALKGVLQFPVRAGCATLAWKALKDALDQAHSG